MKNVMIYNRLENNLRWTDEELFKCLRAQIDNSLMRGWSKEDIILGTNFDFEYAGVKNKPLENVCHFNRFNNKFYGMLELMESGVLNDDFWFHDQDAWQVGDIVFPTWMDGEIGGCKYVFTDEWNTCSMFIKKSAKFVLQYVVELLEKNQHLDYQSDEDMVSLARKYTEVKEYFSTISNKYNVGRTKMEIRYAAADKPVSVIGFAPQSPDSVRVMNGEDNTLNVNLVDETLDTVLKNHFEEYRENF